MTINRPGRRQVLIASLVLIALGSLYATAHRKTGGGSYAEAADPRPAIHAAPEPVSTLATYPLR